jgi:hypothetical protein
MLGVATFLTLLAAQYGHGSQGEKIAPFFL